MQDKKHSNITLFVSEIVVVLLDFSMILVMLFISTIITLGDITVHFVLGWCYQSDSAGDC